MIYHVFFKIRKILRAKEKIDKISEEQEEYENSIELSKRNWNYPVYFKIDDILLNLLDELKNINKIKIKIFLILWII